MKTTHTKTIESITRLDSSVNGNPRFRIYFTDGSAAQTMSDAMFGYAVGNVGMRMGSRVGLVFTRAGRIRHMEPDQSQLCHYCGRQADGEVFHDSGDGLCDRCAVENEWKNAGCDRCGTCDRTPEGDPTLCANCEALAA